jgi:hypothetical protein
MGGSPVQRYLITMSPDLDGQEVEVVLQGPGIQESGRRYVFASPTRCKNFIEAVNFAYEQGLRDGAGRERTDRNNGHKLLLVTGRTPDDLRLRHERWWERSLRRFRARF